MSRPESSWWRMPPPPPRAPHPRREPSLLRWAAPYWVVALGLTGLMQLEVIPIDRWIEGLPALAATSPDAAPTPHAAEETSDTPSAEPEETPSLPARTGTTVASNAMAVFESFPRGDGDEPLLWEPHEAPEAPVAVALADPEPESAEPDEPERAAVAPARAKRRASSKRRRARKKTTAPEPRASRTKASPRPKRTAKKKPTKKKGRAVSRSAGKSCSAAIASYRENVKMGGDDTPADITAAKYGAVLNRGSYFSHCGVPDSMRIHICAAVQNGVAVGVTVTTQPGNARVSSCIAGAVRGLSFPSHPRMDVTRTTFE